MELECSNHGLVGPLTFEGKSIKLEMNYSAQVQSNMRSTEVVNLLCWNRKIRNTFFRVTYSALICKHVVVNPYSHH